jgi:hypothetical protein
MNAKKWLWRSCCGPLHRPCVPAAPRSAKGIGPAVPGQVFQFSDADGNSLCDYTAGRTRIRNKHIVATAPASTFPAIGLRPSVIPTPRIRILTALVPEIVAGVVLTRSCSGLPQAYQDREYRSRPGFASPSDLPGISESLPCLAGTRCTGRVDPVYGSGTPLACNLVVQCHGMEGRT